MGIKRKKQRLVLEHHMNNMRIFSFLLTLSNSYEDISTNSKASAAKKKQDGDYLDLNLNYAFNFK